MARARLLRQAGLPLVRSHAVLRAGAVGAGPDPELQVVRAGLLGGRLGLRRGSQLQPGPRGARQGQMLSLVRVDLAVVHTHPADGTSVEVSVP